MESYNLQMIVSWLVLNSSNHRKPPRPRSKRRSLKCLAHSLSGLQRFGLFQSSLSRCVALPWYTHRALSAVRNMVQAIMVGKFLMPSVSQQLEDERSRYAQAYNSSPAIFIRDIGNSPKICSKMSMLRILAGRNVKAEA